MHPVGGKPAEPSDELPSHLASRITTAYRGTGIRDAILARAARFA